MIRATLIILASIYCLNLVASESLLKIPKGTELIYGRDDRYDVQDYSEQRFIDKSRSVAIRVSNRRLSEDREDSNFLDFPLRKLEQTIPNICASERFVNQYSVGDCSGFLVAPNKLVTAGHCMLTEDDCKNNKWVFEFVDTDIRFSKKNVYSCKKIIAQEYSYTEKEVKDYAVIELDRVVTDRAPLEHRKFGIVSYNTPLLVIGHPLGLPMKISDGAKVSKMNNIEREDKFHSFLLRSDYFTANLDSYGGNSGSPVFNKRTGKVEGIIIQGADDFVLNEDKDCLESRHFSNSHLNTYEKVMRITKIPELNF